MHKGKAGGQRQEKLPSEKLEHCHFLISHQELSLTRSPPPYSSPPFPVCPSNRKSDFSPLHLLSSPLLYECWGVGRGRPQAGHPVRGLLTVPGLSAGAYWREIHINTCLLYLPQLDTARLPAWHRQHCMGLLSRQREDGVSMRVWHLSQSSCCTDGLK